MLNERKGITLIALVVTIIILLILAAVTIALLIGPNGAIIKAKQSKVASRYSKIIDLKDIWEANNKTSVKIKEAPGELTDFTQELLDKNVINSDEKDEIDTNKKLELEYGYVIHFNKESLIKVGDIVYYDPTAGATADQLTYTSPVGSALGGENVSGNGHSVQIFEAKSSDNEWIVIGEENGQLKLMSKDIKISQNNEGLIFQGGRAWLYAEEQLHNICRIYGYGNGADKSLITSYQIGNYEIDEEIQNKTLTGSGARSITARDLEVLTDLTLITSIATAERLNPENAIYMPSLSGTGPNGRCPDTMKKSHLAYTGVWIDKETFNNHLIYFSLKDEEHIFKDESYWLASRSVHTNATQTQFHIRHVNSNYVDTRYPALGTVDVLYNIKPSAIGVRPVVYLKADVQLRKDGERVWTVE